MDRPAREFSTYWRVARDSFQSLSDAHPHAKWTPHDIVWRRSSCMKALHVLVCVLRMQDALSVLNLYTFHGRAHPPNVAGAQLRTGSPAPGACSRRRRVSLTIEARGSHFRIKVSHNDAWRVLCANYGSVAHVLQKVPILHFPLLAVATNFDRVWRLQNTCGTCCADGKAHKCCVGLSKELSLAITAAILANLVMTLRKTSKN